MTDVDRRLISRDAVVVQALRQRKTILVRRGRLRERALDFTEDVAMQLRSFDFWTGYTAGSVAGRIWQRVAV